MKRYVPQISFDMDRGKKLSETEIKRIIELRNKNLTVFKISRIIERSRKIIYNFLKDPANYRKNKSCERQSTLPQRKNRLLYVSPRTPQ